MAQRSSSTTLSASKLTPSTSESVTLTASVGGTNPTGNVIFKDGATTLQTVALSGGTASYSTTFSVGAHSITAGYQGDANHLGSGSSQVTVTAAAGGGSMPVSVPHLGNANAGALPGSASVKGGKSAYNIPIALPPGVAGMVPAVSLAYSGGTQSGIAGVGWTLSGYSSIHRCGPTITQDGQGDTLRLTNKDRLCLDGKRLVLASPANAGTPGTDAFDNNYWSAAAEFRTELESFSRVVRTATGFTVYDRDGRVHTYGGTADSTLDGNNGVAPVTHSWFLQRSKDRLGNAIEYSYTKDASSGAHVLARARWGANASAGQASFAKVEFVYEARPDADVMFVAGGRSDLSQRLKAIQTWTDTAADGTGGVMALDYRLSYTLSPSSGRSMLASVQPCSASDGCLPATSFSWGSPDPAVSRNFVSRGIWTGPVLEDRDLTAPGTAGHSQDEMYVSGDFDGDGLTDLMSRYRGPAIKLFRNTGSAFGTSQPLPGLGNNHAIIEVGDFDADGQTDLLVAQGKVDVHGFLQVINEVLSDWKICYSRLRQGQGFQCNDWAVDGVSAVQRLVYDFNADGRDDLYFSGGSPGMGNSGTQRVCISTGAGFTCTVVSAAEGLSFYKSGAALDLTQYSPLATSDVDGDGRLDQIVAGQAVYNAEGDFWTFNDPQIVSRAYRSDVGKAVTRYEGLLFDYQLPPEAIVNTPPVYQTGAQGAAGDINGDGYSDFLFTYGPTPTANRVTKRCLSTGLLGTPWCEALTGLPSSLPVYWYVGDFDGDGQARLVVDRPLGIGGTVKSCVVRAGDHVSCQSWTKPVPTFSVAINNPSEAWQGGRHFELDLTGDGRPEVVFYEPGGKWHVWQRSDIARPGEALDRLIEVSDGLGLVSRFSYAAQGDASVYTPDVQDAAGSTLARSYPQKPVPRLEALVHSLKLSNGQGGWLETRYRYAGGASDQSGRGYLGFARIDSTDVASNITTSTWYSQSWPHVGTITATRQATAGGVGTRLLESSSVPAQLALTLPSGRSTVFAYTASQATSRRDLDGSDLGSSTSSWTYSDGWGNVTELKETVSGGGKSFQSTTTTAYQNNAGTWLLGLPTRTTVAKVRDGVTVTRTSAASYDANRLLATRTVEPDDLSYRLLTSYSRVGNAWGLVSKTTQSWRDPATGTDQTRTTAEVVAFDTKGRYALNTKNALGHLEKREFDPRHGLPTRLTTPNGQVTVWSADAFGRVSSELRPDGTEQRQWLKRCDAECPPLATHVAISDNYQGGQRFGVPSLSYFDGARHLLRKRSNGFDGQVIVSDTRYDARGRPTETDHPRFATASAQLAGVQAYDDLNRVISSTSYDEAGVARKTTVSHAGLSVTTRDAKNQASVALRDAQGLLQQATDALQGVTNYAREPFGGLIQVTDPKGNVVRITLDRLGRRTDLQDPDLGALKYDVDPLGRVWRQKNARLQSTTFGFDALDRMISRLEPDLSSYWVYDSAANGIGQVAEAYTLAGSVKDYRRVHSYDALGRPVASVITIDGRNYSSSTSYDSYGRVRAISHRLDAYQAKVFDHVYNAQGYLQRIERAGQSLWAVQEQDAAQRVTKAALGNGLTQTRSYHPQSGRLTADTIANAQGNAQLIQGYAYDPLGLVEQRSHLWGGAGYSERFSYDALNRLKTAQILNRPDVPMQSYDYDAIGNLVAKTGVGSYTYPLPGQPRPHAVSSVSSQAGSYAYDASGNLSTGPGGLSMSWKSFDMPSQMTAGAAWSQFAYGPEHQRARQSMDGDKAVHYAGAMELDRYLPNGSGGFDPPPPDPTAGSSSNKLRAKGLAVVAGGGGQLISFERRLRTYWPMGLGLDSEVLDVAGAPVKKIWIHTDRQGSVMAHSNESGVLVDGLAYDPWGQRRSTDGASTNVTSSGLVEPRGYTGHEMLDGLGMVHMNGRIYHPVLARFISADPIIQEPEHSQSYNRYSYVWNNPTNMTDPTGMAASDDDNNKELVKKAAPRTLRRFDRFGNWRIILVNPDHNGAEVKATGQGGASNTNPTSSRETVQNSNKMSESAAKGGGSILDEPSQEYRDQVYQGRAGSCSTPTVVCAQIRNAEWHDEFNRRREPGLGHLGEEAVQAATFALPWGRFGKFAAESVAAKGAEKSFFRSMSKAEAEAIKAMKDTGTLRGGRAGDTFFTDSRFRSADRARDRLSLESRPEVQMEFRITNEPSLVRNGTRVDPAYGGRGGGREFMTRDPVKVEIINVQPY